MPKLTEQELRAEFMAQLIAQKSMAIQDAMLAVDAVVALVLTGEIRGLRGTGRLGLCNGTTTSIIIAASATSPQHSAMPAKITVS